MANKRTQTKNHNARIVLADGKTLDLIIPFSDEEMEAAKNDHGENSTEYLTIKKSIFKFQEYKTAVVRAMINSMLTNQFPEAMAIISTKLQPELAKKKLTLDGSTFTVEYTNNDVVYKTVSCTWENLLAKLELANTFQVSKIGSAPARVAIAPEVEAVSLDDFIS